MRLRTAVACLVLTLSVPALAADKPQTVEAMRAAADAAQPEQCTKVCVEFAQRLVEESDRFFNVGDVPQGNAAMADAVKYARKATDAAMLHRKKQKNLEIALRKMSKRMTDIEGTLALEDRPVIAKNIEEVEHMRSELLEAMFGGRLKKETQ